MSDKGQTIKILLAYLLTITAFIVLIAYTLAKLVGIPYIGFTFNPSGGIVASIFVKANSEDSPQLGDRLIRVGTIDWNDFKSSRRMTLFDKQPDGSVVEILVVRDGQEKRIFWKYPGFNRAELLDRLNSVIWLAYAFWFAGIATVLLIQPKDTRWVLMVAFYQLTTIWVASGSISGWHVWESAIVLRAAIWLSLPVYWHFHWHFPAPLKPLPTYIWWIVYAIGFLMAGLEWLEILPRSAYYFGFLLALLGSLLILIFRSLIPSKYRRDIRLLIGASVFSMVPALVLGFTGTINRIPWEGSLALSAFPLMPGAYFYTVYSHQTGGVRLRTNRQISFYVYFLLLGIASVVLIPLIVTRLNSLDSVTIVATSATLIFAVSAVILYPPFQRFFEHRILGIPPAPTYILSTYSDRITTSLSKNNLKRILEDEILPSLLIRQSALLELDEQNSVSVLYSSGVNPIHSPSEADISLLLAHAGNHRPTTSLKENKVFGWVHLIFPLKVESKMVGLWLLGNRDPDDVYAESEISVLETIANHTAIALVNIAQAERLLMLYQSNIERQEVERTSLARDLHDEVLNQLAGLSMTVSQQATPEFHESYDKVTSRIREMVSDLRPAMLTYGLRAAIEELVDNLSDRAGGGTIIMMDLPGSEIRYPPTIEENLYRIVQQSCENALQHAKAKIIRVRGTLKATEVALTVEDDGIGFEALEDFSIEKLLAAKHYGLAGIQERAALIGAELRIGTSPGIGTHISVKWQLSDEA